MTAKALIRKLDYLDRDIAQLKSEGPYLEPDYWVERYNHSETGKPYYRKRWINPATGRRGQEMISAQEYEVLRERIYRGRKLARLQRQRDQVAAEIEKVKEFADRYGLTVPS